MASTIPLAHGWKLYAWSAFQERFRRLVAEVNDLKQGDPAGYKHHETTKLLAAVYRLVADIIPREPGASRFQQGNTLGSAYRHWYRAKHRRYRLFYRFHSGDRAIVYAWLNDDHTLRAEGAKTDPYSVFQKMLEAGRPPTSWSALIDESDGFQELLDLDS